MKNILRLSLISLATALLLSACRADENPFISGNSDTNSSSGTTPISAISQAIFTAETNGTIPTLNHDDTIAGPDTDGNGIRDDIDAYIATLPYTEVQKKAVQQDARAIAATLTVDTNDSTTLNIVGEKMMRAVNCIVDTLDTSNNLQPADQISSSLEKMTINTKIRFKQYEKYNSARSGSVTDLPDGDTCDN